MKLTAKFLIAVSAALIIAMFAAGCSSPLEPSSAGYSAKDLAGYEYDNINRSANNAEYPTFNYSFTLSADTRSAVGKVTVVFPTNQYLDLLEETDNDAFISKFNASIKFYNRAPIDSVTQYNWGQTSLNNTSTVSVSNVVRAANVVYADLSGISSPYIFAAVKASEYTVKGGKVIDRDNDGILKTDIDSGEYFAWDDLLVDSEARDNNSNATGVIFADGTKTTKQVAIAQAWSLNPQLNMQKRNPSSYSDLYTQGYATITNTDWSDSDPDDKSNYSSTLSAVKVQRLDTATNSWTTVASSWTRATGGASYYTDFPLTAAAYRLYVENPESLVSTNNNGFKNRWTLSNNMQVNRYKGGYSVMTSYFGGANYYVLNAPFFDTTDVTLYNQNEAPPIFAVNEGEAAIVLALEDYIRGFTQKDAITGADAKIKLVKGASWDTYQDVTIKGISFRAIDNATPEQNRKWQAVIRYDSAGLKAGDALHLLVHEDVYVDKYYMIGEVNSYSSPMIPAVAGFYQDLQRLGSKANDLFSGAYKGFNDFYLDNF